MATSSGELARVASAAGEVVTAVATGRASGGLGVAKINTIPVHESRAAADATHERVLQDRQYQIDACLVRIMKARKALTHAQLMGELLAQLRFPAKVSDCKKRIDSLIERDYLERSEDGGTYTYVS